MKKHQSLTGLFTFLVITLLTLSCKNDSPEPGPDLSINSTDNFEVISSYDNGWIKEGTKKDPSGTPMAAFEYHENGYLKSVNTYQRFPIHYLFSSLERDVSNNPLSAKYYYPNGDTFISILYENGHISSKTLFSEDGTETVSNYQNGLIQRIERSNNQNDRITSVAYDHDAQKRVLTITVGTTIIRTEELPLNDELGNGINTLDDLLLSRFASPTELNERRLLTAQSSSLRWKFSLDPLTHMPAPILYDRWLNRVPEMDVRMIGYDDTYRSVSEQYPFAESRILVSNFQSVDNEVCFFPEIETLRVLGTELQENLDEFTEAYGDEFNNQNFYGKYLVTVATLRNLPTDPVVRDQIEEIAFKHASYLVSDNEIYSITQEEETLLSQVFFELKAHSSSLDNVNGVVINTPADYEEVIQSLEDAPLEIIQKEFKKYSTVAINN